MLARTRAQQEKEDILNLQPNKFFAKGAFSITIKDVDVKIGVAPSANSGSRRVVHPQPATRRR